MFIHFKKVTLLLLILSTSAQAQNLYWIKGRVTDAEKDPIPGVTFYADSYKPLGSKICVSDAHGFYRMGPLVPDIYELRSSFTGFKAQTKVINITSESPEILSIDFTLIESEDYTPIFERPCIAVVDYHTSAREFHTLNRQFRELIPHQIENYHQLLGQPLTSSNSRNQPTLFSRPHYLLNDSNISGILFDNHLLNMPIEDIEKMTITSAGYQVDMGRTAGAIINVKPEHGDNEWKGTIHYSNQPSKLAATRTAPYHQELSKQELSASIAGPIIMDRLWFRSSVSPQQVDGQQKEPDPLALSNDVKRTNVATRSDTNRWSANLFYRPDTVNDIEISAYTTSPEIKNDKPITTSGYDGYEERELENYQIRWKSFFHVDREFQATYNHYREQGRRYQNHKVPNENLFENDPQANDRHRAHRNHLNVHFASFWKKHDLKIGLELEETRIDYLQHFSPANQEFNELNAKNRYFGFFIKDIWELTPNVILNAGIRHELRTLFDSEGHRLHNFDDQISPRVGATYDLTGEGRTKLYGHWGRFYQDIPIEFSMRTAMDEYSNRSMPFIDENAQATNYDEIIMGFEYEFYHDASATILYTKRQFNDLLLDVTFNGGQNTVISNPGGTIQFANNQNETVTLYDALENRYHLSPGSRIELLPEQIGISRLWQDFESYELIIRKNAHHGFTLFGSYSYNAYKGNVPTLPLPHAHSMDGTNAILTSPANLVNAEGVLSQHRPHILNFLTSFKMVHDFSIGTRIQYQSGSPFDALSNTDNNTGAAYGNVHLLPRGSIGKLPSLTRIDLRLAYTISFDYEKDLYLYADILNLFDSQSITAASQIFSEETPDLSNPQAEWNVGRHTPQGEDVNEIYAMRYYQWLDGRFHTLDELEQWYQANDLSWNADTWGKPLAYQTGRRTRIGARFRF